MQRMNNLPQFGFLFEKMPAIVESLPWHAPQLGEEPQEPYGYLSNVRVAAELLLPTTNSWNAQHEGLHSHTMTAALEL
jgi:hypothetical protein